MVTGDAPQAITDAAEAMRARHRAMRDLDWEELAKAAAPHLAAITPEQARVVEELLQEALYLHGERTPADHNGWRNWAAKTQAFLIGFRAHLRELP